MHRQLRRDLDVCQVVQQLQRGALVAAMKNHRSFAVVTFRQVLPA